MKHEQSGPHRSIKRPLPDDVDPTLSSSNAPDLIPSLTSTAQTRTKRPRLSPSDTSPSPPETFAPTPHPRLSTISSHPEIFLLVLSFLSARDLVIVEGVCKRWRRAGLDGQLWKSIYLSDPILSRTDLLPLSRPQRQQALISSYVPPNSVPSTQRDDGPGDQELRIGDQELRIGREESDEIIRRPPFAEPVNPNAPKSTLIEWVKPSYEPLPDKTRGVGSDFEVGFDVGTAAEEVELEPNVESVRLFSPLPSRVRSFNKDTYWKSMGARSTPQRGLARPLAPTSRSDTRLDPDSHNDHHPQQTDWKRLVRLGTNWSNGNARVRRLGAGGLKGEFGVGSKLGVQEVEGDGDDSVSARAVHDIGDVEHKIAFGRRPSLDATPSALSIPIVALAPGLVLVAYPRSPLVHVYSATRSSAGPGEVKDGPGRSDAPLMLIPPPPGWSSPSRPDAITALAVDDGLAGKTRNDVDPIGRVVIWYESGGWAIVEILTSATEDRVAFRPGWRRVLMQEPANGLQPRRSRRQAHAISAGDPFLLGRMLWPIVIGCTKAFYISVWRIRLRADTGVAEAVLMSTLHSPVSSWPATIRLMPVHSTVRRDIQDRTGSTACAEDDNVEAPTKQYFRASLAYCTPLYPQSWTVAVQDIGISIFLCEAYPGEPSATGLVAVERSSHVKRSLGGYGASWFGKMKRKLGWTGRSGNIVGVKGEQAIGIGLDERWCVLAGADNQVQVFALPRTDKDSNDVESPNEIEHSQTLLAHASSVTSLAISSGRCVTSGSDGRLLVWDLNQEAMLRPIEDDGQGGLLAGEYVGWREKADLECVEVRTRSTRLANRVRPSQDSTNDDKGTGKGKGKECAEPIISTATPTRALRQSVLPCPPALHPLSLVSAAEELHSTYSPRSDRRRADWENSDDDESGQMQGATPRAGIRGIVFNEEMIVGVVPGFDREEQHGVRMWKFDV